MWRGGVFAALIFGFALIGCPRRTPPTPPATASNSAPRSIYFVLVDRFANGDPSNDATISLDDPHAFHGGDLEGVLDRLDHIAGLGFDTVWLSPVFQMRTEPFFGHGAFHGYWVQDPTRIEPRFGGEATLRRLSDALHARGMKLMLDVVYNHVSFDAPLRTEKPAWFHNNGPILDWNDPVQRVEHEVHGLPDLAQENEEVYAWLRDWSIGWMDAVKPDGFRLDAVGHMPVSFMARIAADLRSHAPIHLLGEVYDGDPMVLARARQEGGLDQVFDFPLHFAMLDVFCREQHPGRLGATLALDPIYGGGQHLVPFLDNHDRPRVRTVCGDDPQKVGQALRFLLSARGTPALSYGTEAGLVGGDEPANRGDMRFDAGAPEEAVIRAWMRHRAASPALTEGVGRTLQLTDHALVHLRATEREIAVIVVNRGAESLVVELPPALAALPFRDLETGGEGRLVAPAQSVTVGVRSGEFSDWTAPPPLVEVLLPAEGFDHVVGTGPWLGNWTPRDELVATDGVVRVRVPAGSVLEYKPMSTAGGAARWADGPNRYVLATAP